MHTYTQKYTIPKLVSFICSICSIHLWFDSTREEKNTQSFIRAVERKEQIGCENQDSCVLFVSVWDAKRAEVLQKHSYTFIYAVHLFR